MILMSGRTKINLVNAVIAAIVNLFLNYLLIPRFGITGAALATGASLIILNILALLEVWVILKIHPYSSKFIKPVIAGLIAFMFYFIISKALAMPVNSLAGFAFSVVSFVFIYILSIWFLKLDEDDKIVSDILRSKMGF